MSPASPYGSPSMAVTQGTHCWCYSNFTNVGRIEQLALKEESTSEVKSQSIGALARKQSGASNDVLFSSTEGLFCGKHR